ILLRRQLEGKLTLLRLVLEAEVHLAAGSRRRSARRRGSLLEGPKFTLLGRLARVEVKLGLLGSRDVVLGRGARRLIFWRVRRRHRRVDIRTVGLVSGRYRLAATVERGEP